MMIFQWACPYKLSTQQQGPPPPPRLKYLGYSSAMSQNVYACGPAVDPFPNPYICIPLQTSVAFLDLTPPPVEVLKSISDVWGKVPEGFFYPFLVANSVLSLQLSEIVFLSCLVLTRAWLLVSSLTCVCYICLILNCAIYVMLII